MIKLILVIDDDVVVRESIAVMLEDRGYRIIAAANGRLGEKAFRDNNPDLVLVDIIMPEQEGIETIVNLRRNHPVAKIVAMSGAPRIGSQSFLQLAKRAGADEIIKKPFDQRDIVRVVERVIAARQ